MRISKEDLVGGVVNSQSTGPLQLGCDDGADVCSIHANSSNISIVSPVSPVEPSEEQGLQTERLKTCSKIKWTFLQQRANILFLLLYSLKTIINSQTDSYFQTPV